MTDIKERLRERSQQLWTFDKELQDNKLFNEAADEIEYWRGHAERLREGCEFHLAEIQQLRNQIRIVQYSMMIPEYDLQNMNATNVLEYEHHVKERMARYISHELMEKGLVVFKKEDWKGRVTVSASLKVIQND